MKKHLSILLIALGVVTLLCAVIIVSCTANTPQANEESSSATQSTVETDTIEEQTHLQESELLSSTEHISKQESESTEKPQGEATESHVSSTGTSIDSESESETDSQPTSPSFSFTSNNNGTCTLTGIGEITDSYISIPSRSPDGDIVTAIAEKAFYSNDLIKAIEIPSTVMSIGNMAFSNCRSLLYISVDSDNTMFRDLNGVLFSHDLSTLICYPSGSGMSSFDMPYEVKTISDMAFYNCSSLKTVVYPGTIEEWSAILIGQQNYGLISAAVSCK